MSEKVKICFFATSVLSEDPIDFEAEEDSIDERLRITGDRYELTHKVNISYVKLSTELVKQKPTIVHFCGHGSESGLAIRGDADPEITEILDDDQLILLFRRLSAKIVILSYCSSSKQAKLLNEKYPSTFVIGMNEKFKDELGARFSSVFYAMIAAGATAAHAFESGQLGLLVGQRGIVEAYGNGDFAPFGDSDPAAAVATRSLAGEATDLIRRQIIFAPQDDSQLAAARQLRETQENVRRPRGEADQFGDSNLNRQSVYTRAESLHGLIAGAKSLILWLESRIEGSTNEDAADLAEQLDRAKQLLRGFDERLDDAADILFKVAENPRNEAEMERAVGALEKWCGEKPTTAQRLRDTWKQRKAERENKARHPTGSIQIASPPPPSPTRPSTPPGSGFLRRLAKGDVAILVGPDIALESGLTAPDLQSLSLSLQQQANCPDLGRELPTVAQYFEWDVNLGTNALVSSLRLGLAANGTIPFFDVLRRIDKPLVCISAAYDGLLERSLIEADRKVAVILCASAPSPEGDLAIRIPQRGQMGRAETKIIRAADLANERLLETGHDIIFHPLGQIGGPTDRETEFLTITEANHFSFARRAEEIIPHYIARLLSSRGLLILGLPAKSWEQRLLIMMLLERRRDATRKNLPVVVRGRPGQFEAAFWANQPTQLESWSLNALARDLAREIL